MNEPKTETYELGVDEAEGVLRRLSWVTGASTGQFRLFAEGPRGKDVQQQCRSLMENAPVVQRGLRHKPGVSLCCRIIELSESQFCLFCFVLFSLKMKVLRPFTT